jgi:putative hydrolase of HD superfamily
MRPNETLLDLLLELQALDRVPRLGYLLRGVSDPESITEHSWHVLFMVWALAPRIEGLDAHRAIGMAMVHDLAELRLGDLPRTAARYLPPGAKNAGEKAAAVEMLAPLSEESRALFDEYQAGQSPEARLVKACDKLQLMIKVAVYEGWGAKGLTEFWGNPDNFPDGGFEPVRELFEELQARRRDAT